MCSLDPATLALHRLASFEATLRVSIEETSLALATARKPLSYATIRLLVGLLCRGMAERSPKGHGTYRAKPLGDGAASASRKRDLDECRTLCSRMVALPKGLRCASTVSNGRVGPWRACVDHDAYLARTWLQQHSVRAVWLLRFPSQFAWQLWLGQKLYAREPA